MTIDKTRQKSIARIPTRHSRVGKGEFHPQTSHRTVREPLDSYGSYYAVNILG